MRCECIKKDGKQCTRDAQTDSRLCWQHDKCQVQVVKVTDQPKSSVSSAKGLFEEYELETLEYFNQLEPSDPSLQWTIRDVKAELYTAMANSMGTEDYSSITDTLPREMIWTALENRVANAKETVYESLTEMYIDDTGKINGRTVDYDKLSESDELVEIVTKAINDYVLGNKAVTYTNVQSYDHRDKVYKLISDEIIKRKLDVFEK
jgi:hypothetical protein